MTSTLDEIRALAIRWVALWRATWTNPDDRFLDAQNMYLYSTALEWIERQVVPEVVILGAEWLRIAATAAMETIEDSDEDELNPEWLQLDREIIDLYERIRNVGS